MKICTESDYLHAHISIIQSESHASHAPLRIVTNKVLSQLKEWILRNAKPIGVFYQPS